MYIFFDFFFDAMHLVEGDVAKSSTHLGIYLLVDSPPVQCSVLLFFMKESIHSLLNKVFKDAAATR
jgi:hypothetical protein